MGFLFLNLIIRRTIKNNEKNKKEDNKKNKREKQNKNNIYDTVRTTMMMNHKNKNKKIII